MRQQTKHFLVAFLLCVCPMCCMAQLSRADTVLYLYFDEMKYYKAPLFITLTKGGELKLIISYSFGSVYLLYDGLPLDFTTGFNPKPDTIEGKKLRHLKVATYQQLITFIQNTYPVHSTSAYFRKLKGIYMVEPDKRKKGRMTVTKVELDIDIE